MFNLHMYAQLLLNKNTDKSNTHSDTHTHTHTHTQTHTQSDNVQVYKADSQYRIAA